MDNYSSTTEAGSVLTPVDQNTTGSAEVEVNKENELVRLAKERLIDNKTQQFFVGKSTKKHYIVTITESSGEPVSVSTIIEEYHSHGSVNPKPAYQRPTGQHSSKIQKGILLDFLCGERVGTIVLYQPENRYQKELVDGGQRISIIKNFVNGNLKLTGQQANKFWAYFLSDIIRGREQKYDNALKVECNKILKSIATLKSTPTVKFENLPHNVRSKIRALTFDCKLISRIVFKCIEDETTLSFESADYDETKVIEMVRSKFTKLNLQQKPVQPIHQIWGSRDEYNIKSRGYVETIPGIMNSLGYKISDVDSTQNEEIIRTFNDLLVRSMLGFDKKIKWGLGITKVAENLLDAVYDDEIPNHPNSFGFIEFMKNRLNKVFTSNFNDKLNQNRRIEIASEIVGVGQKAVMQRLFILSLMEFWILIQEENKITKYINGENINDTLFKFVELLSKIISTVSMRTLDKNEYQNEEKPMKKYELYTMYISNQKTFDNLIKLGGHSQKDDTLVKKTLREIVKLVDEYTI